MIPCQGSRAETRVRQLLFISAGVIRMKGCYVWSCSGGLLVREHGGSFSKVGDESLFSVIVFSQLAAVLSDKGPPTQLHASPPFIEITPALMNSNLLPRVSAPEPWQGIFNIVRSLDFLYLNH